MYVQKNKQLKINMKYIIEQYPKNKNIDFSIMSIEQRQLRLSSSKKKYEYGNEIKCKVCGTVNETKEYYIKDKKTGRRSASCRDCELKKRGVIEIGKIRFSLTIADKGFRRCAVCKEIKPLNEYKKNKRQYLGISNNCYTCSKKLHFDFTKKQKENLGDSYVKEYGKLKGIKNFDKEIISKLKSEILNKRKSKYFIDNREFSTVSSFATYLKDKYGMPITMTKSRIANGKTEEECKLTEEEMRSLKNGNNKGTIKVTDTVTSEVFTFHNTKDKALLKMFGLSTMYEGLKKGTPVGGKRSKYTNPCLIERIQKNEH